MHFHHIGFVVENIEKHEQNLFFGEKTAEVVDPVQKAKLALYKNFDTSYIELIEPLETTSFTWNALQKNGNHFHHLCYETDNLDELARLQQRYRWIEILKPVPAILFDNRLVTFYFTRNKQIIEFLISQQ